VTTQAGNPVKGKCLYEAKGLQLQFTAIEDAKSLSVELETIEVTDEEMETRTRQTNVYKRRLHLADLVGGEGQSAAATIPDRESTAVVRR